MSQKLLVQGVTQNFLVTHSLPLLLALAAAAWAPCHSICLGDEFHFFVVQQCRPVTDPLVQT
jgi:hypothetical protein